MQHIAPILIIVRDVFRCHSGNPVTNVCVMNILARRITDMLEILLQSETSFSQWLNTY